MGLNVLWDHTHGVYEWEVSKTGANLTVFDCPTAPNAITTQRPFNDNTKFVSAEEGWSLLDAGWPDVLVIGHANVLKQAEKHRIVPTILMCHVERMTVPLESPIPFVFAAITAGCGIRSGVENCVVIRHGTDIEDYVPWKASSSTVLSVCTRLRERGQICGYDLWNVLTRQRNRLLLGTNPTIQESRLSKSWADYKGTLASSRVFLNTTARSPFPMALMDAMCSGMPIVTTSTMDILDFLADGETAIAGTDPAYLEWALDEFSGASTLALRLGANARERAQEMFDGRRFRSDWMSLWEQVRP